MLALLALICPVLAGFLVLERIAGHRLRPSESLLWGLVLSWVAFAMGAFGLALWQGRLEPATMAVYVGLTATVTALVAVWSLRSLDWRRYVRFDPALACLSLVFGCLFFRLFRHELPVFGEQGMVAGGSQFFDGPFHYGLIQSFLLGDNFPPVNPYLPPLPLKYPWLPDFHAALMDSLGLNLHGALLVTAVPLALAAMGLFYHLARRILEACRPAMIATMLFLLNGPATYLYFFEDWRRSPAGLLRFIMVAPDDYGNRWDQQLVFGNLISEAMLPQRPILYGLPLALMVITLLAMVWRDMHAEKAPAQGSSTKLLLAAGALSGLVAYVHSFSFLALGVVAALLFLLRPDRGWSAYGLAAGVVASPQLVAWLSLAGGDRFVYLQPGWMAANEGHVPLFLLRNFGVPLLFAGSAWLMAKRPWRRFYLAFVGLFAFSLVVMVSPHDFNNVKLMYYWYGLTCILVADWLVRLARTHGQWLLASTLFLLSVATAVISINQRFRVTHTLFNRTELHAAAFVQTQTAPHALFASGRRHNDPIVSLAGRRTFIGNGSLLWSHGYGTSQPERERALASVFGGGAAALTAIRIHGIDYVYIGETERREFRANQAWYERTFARPFQAGDVAIFDVRQLNGASRRPTDESPSGR